MIRPAFAAKTVIATHLLDIATFWLAIDIYRIPISRERNPLGFIQSAYLAGGFWLFLAAELAVLAIVLWAMSKVRRSHFVPLYVLAYGSGLVGAAMNLYAISRFGGFTS